VHAKFQLKSSKFGVDVFFERDFPDAAHCRPQKTPGAAAKKRTVEKRRNSLSE
jgi:hypothetical protein